MTTAKKKKSTPKVKKKTAAQLALDIEALAGVTGGVLPFPGTPPPNTSLGARNPLCGPPGSRSLRIACF